ncbi:MAG: cardiolipin synthase [Bacteroidales bacterium]|jgi:cardiolipin synthase|nr:cardiolipin synthase [Bacteroidales bacterium]MDD3273096.1 cardiolipin synthase [Bacteroidales bacterium]MDD4058538.1 cardiolipin synthase [Bacteroidales bacterium]
MTYWEVISIILYFVYFILAIYASFVIMYKKLDPVKSLSWIIVILLLPYIGLVLYLFFGQNFRKTKIYNRKGVRDERFRRLGSYRQLKEFKNNPNLLPEELTKYRKLINLNLKGNKSLLGLNSEINLYFSGKDALDSMYESILDATQHIHLQSYIIENDITGNKFKNLLLKKAAEGVEVRVIYDDVGCWNLSSEFKNDFLNTGIEFLSFGTVKWFLSPLSKLNYRNHRKILVIDGKIGFLGGVNIADRYYNGGNFEEWRDTHMKISGESVAALQSSFLLDRYFIINEQFRRKRKYYPHLSLPDIRVTGENSAYYSQIITSGPDSDWASIMQCYFAAISKATHHIYLITPYFTPNESLLNALKIAALGGVEVCLMLPQKSDSIITHWCTLSYAAEMLEAGVKVYLFSKGFNHSKVISIDGEFCIIGSANFDNRSMEHNFEITSIIYNKEIAVKLEEQFIKDTEKCISLAGSKWAKRSIQNQIKESFARLFSPLL